MTSYIATLAQKIYTKHQHQLQDITFIFPTPQSAHLFKQHIGCLHQAPIWAPRTYLLPTFIQTLYPLRELPHLAQIAKLYETVQSIKQITLSQFMVVANDLLREFDTIDQHFMATEELFSAMEKQSVFGEATTNTSSEASLQYLEEIATLMPQIYRAYREQLLKDQVAYPGLHYQEVYRLLGEQKLAILDKHIILIGMHPLPPIIQAIFTKLQEKVTVDFYYDLHNCFFHNKEALGGYHLRAYAQNPLLNRHLQPPYLASSPKEVKLVASPTQVGQVEIVASEVMQRIKSATNGSSKERIAIVLLDPTLLVPLLYALPADISLDIQVPYPYVETPICQLFTTLLNFHYQLLQTPTSPALTTSFATLLAHPYLQVSTGIVEQLQASFQQNPLLLHKANTTCKLWNQLLSSPTQQGVWNYLLTSLAHIEAHVLATTTLASWELVSLQKTKVHFLRFQQILQPKIPFELTKGFLKFFQQQTNNIGIAIPQQKKGNVEITHLFTTQHQDYDHVVLVSMNEKIFPKRAISSPLIPEHIKRATNWPTPQAQEAEEAYLFQRLLYKSQTVSIVYHVGKDAEGLNEMSRYVRQLLQDKDLPIKNVEMVPHIIPSASQPIIIHKESAILQKLTAFLNPPHNSQTLSPSALNTYLDCSLRFYFQYIMQLTTTAPPTSIISPAIFGKIFHQILERLYQPYMGKAVQYEDIQHLKKAIPKLITSTLAQLIAQDSTAYRKGTGKIIEKVLYHAVVQVLKQDQAYAPFSLMGLEVGKKNKLRTALCLADKTTISIGGIIDRIDQKKEQVRIVDYKTGSWYPQISSIGSLFDRTHATRNKIALQTMLYAWLYAREFPSNNTAIKPAILSPKHTATSPTDFHFLEDKKKFPIIDINTLQDSFEEHLVAIVKEILDPTVPFVQTPHQSMCQHCPYHSICHRK